jgi:hypothetical protein
MLGGEGVNYLPRPKSNGGWFAGAAHRLGYSIIGSRCH